MSRIPFIEARFFEHSHTVLSVQKRLTAYLQDLRAGKSPAPKITNFDLINGKSDGKVLPRDMTRIIARAERIVERQKTLSKLSHLPFEEKAQLEGLSDGANLVCIPTEHRADELAAQLHAEMPWMAPATDRVWHAMRRSVHEGWSGLRLPPILLDGPPGIGKSHWARKLGEILSAPVSVIEATNENAGFGLVGHQRGWASGAPGRLLQTVLQTRVANPVMVVDEVEKAGTTMSQNGGQYGLAAALLPLLEPLTAQRWSCPYYQVKFDMSWVIWVLTSNDYRSLPVSLLSRCPPIHLSTLTLVEIVGFARREGARRGLSEASIETAVEILIHPSLRDLRPSLRTAARLLQRAAELERAPSFH